MRTAETTSASPPPPDTDERQPPGLWTLSSVALWERLSFYGLQVILAYYIYYSVADGGLGLPDTVAVAIAGAYGGAVYLVQPIGAWIADRLVPARALVFAGLVIILAGHLTLAVAQGLGGLLTGLTLIVLGSGALLPNIWAMLNLLYAPDSPRRDFGFTFYYVGILIGALVGPIVTGFLQVQYGFHAGFSAAAAGMLIGLVSVFIGRKTLPAASSTVPNPLPKSSRGRVALIAVAGIAVIAALVALQLLTAETVNHFVLAAAFLAAAVYVVSMVRSSKVTVQERSRVLAYVPLFLVSVIFWTLILQLFTTFAIYADTRVDLTVLGITIPAAYISTFQVVAAIVAGPALAAAGQRRLRRAPDRAPAPATKLATGMGIMTVTFALFAILSALLGTALIPLGLVIVGMVLFGIAEVSFAPILFSVTGQMAPKAFNAQMMALTGLSLAAGASLSGFAGQLYTAIDETLHFGLMAAAAAVGALVFLAVRRSWAAAGVQ